MSLFFVNNRRDGARLLSSALVVLSIALTQIGHVWGIVISVLVLLLCIYWSFLYTRLDR